MGLSRRGSSKKDLMEKVRVEKLLRTVNLWSELCSTDQIRLTTVLYVLRRQTRPLPARRTAVDLVYANLVGHVHSAALSPRVDIRRCSSAAMSFQYVGSSMN